MKAQGILPKKVNRQAAQGDYMFKMSDSPSRVEPDVQLLNLAAQGDEQAFAELYQRFSAAIYRYLLHMVFDEIAAEELLQDVFVGAWRGARRFREQSSVKTWLFRIAHHQAVSWLRRRRETERFEHEEAGDDPEQAAMENWRRDAVRRAVAGLSTDHRAVVELAYYHGLAYAEIAEVMACPVGTVKSRMSHARRYLDEALKQAGIDLHFE
ncbi:MAG: sigma-70 family RNA polymerase sigma factor [Chloroflexi bacterium]|nr:sigma-70 family RNA polymerase sigma factor [Chloroflexota bacterium]